MNCDEASGLRIDALLDRISAADRTRLDEHDRTCEACAMAGTEMRQIWEAAGRLDRPTLAPEALIRFGRRLERSGPAAKRRRFLLAASYIALLASGTAIGRWLDAGSALDDVASGRQYVLFLRGTEPDRRLPQELLARQYGEWARTLDAAGAYVSSAELAPTEFVWLDPPDGTEDRTAPISGFFVVRADDLDSAAALGRGSPHLAHGGAIEIRPIVDTP